MTETADGTHLVQDTQCGTRTEEILMTETAELVNLIPASLSSLTGIFIFLAALAVVLMFCRKFLAALAVAKMKKWCEAYQYLTEVTLPKAVERYSGKGEPIHIGTGSEIDNEVRVWRRYKFYTSLAELLGADWQPVVKSSGSRYLQRADFEDTSLEGAHRVNKELSKKRRK